MSAKILVADDEAPIRQILQIELAQKGYEVLLACDAPEAVALCRKHTVDAAILDVRMPGPDGFYALREIRRSSPDTAVIMITAFGTIDGAVDAMKTGADEYITKPFDSQELLAKLSRLIQYKQKRRVHDAAAPAVGKEPETSLIGDDRAIIQIKNTIGKIKDLDTTILITGESGTGKGVVAKEIHRCSNRSSQPFIHVDCAFLPPSLIESELFGHEKGAFTSAGAAQKGRFELAGRGTVFLDEIGTLPIGLQ
ncbi:MAG: sigma 54-interacting transcriptional regulator, partial [Oscillospiraceae bacterium]